MTPDTQLINHPYKAPDEFEASTPGAFKASTVLFPNVAAMRSRQWADRSAYTYGTHGTPTTFTLEARLATLEGAKHCVLTPSGLLAIGLVDMAFLDAGDEVLIPANAYGPGKAFAHGDLARWGIQTTFFDPLNPNDLAEKISAKTRLVWLEAAGSITLEFPDVPACVAVVRAANDAGREGRAGRARPIITALDNTWGAGVAFQAFEMGVDLSMQALTKYPSGGGDVLMGAVFTRDAALHNTLQMCHMRLGICLGANDAELVLRGLQTIHVRYHHQDATTRSLAEWAVTRQEFAAVRHPALPDSPGHATWLRDCSAAACLFSVVFKPCYSSAQVDAFCDRLTVFGLGYSWAGPMSLAVPYSLDADRGCGEALVGVVVRFAVGLAHVDDLRADLAQALDGMVADT